MKDDVVEMDIKHKDRVFQCEKIPNTEFLLPKRQFFVQLVKFAPGKGPKDFFDFYIHLDAKVQKMYGGKRCKDMDIHEIANFLTWGSYDMIVLWDAPNMEAANKLLAASLDPGDYGSCTTLPVALTYRHVG